VTAPVVAILGGGQLGRMLAQAGQRLGVACRLLDPDPAAPAGAVAPTITAAWDDARALSRLVAGATVATWEVEHVPLATVRRLAGQVPVFPPPACLEAVQDRACQKQLLDQLGIATAPWAAPQSLEDLPAAVDRLGLPSVIKTRRGGYDGRGQAVLRRTGEAAEAWRRFGGHDLIVEGFIPFDDECSLVSVRAQDGSIRHWPLVENRHSDGVLATTLAPHPHWSAGLQEQAEQAMSRIMARLDYVGVMAVEFFRCDGRLLVNELAPRVHNSGHWTMDGADCSQFENHLRALLGWPLGGTGSRGHAAMVNCLGSVPDARCIRLPGVHRHDYGKIPRPGRKVGHLNIIGRDEVERDGRLADLLRLIA
jgi:5-(carboxyamino)imidazole ribonucleotide synthase